jgi:hypothetical protein
MQKLKKHTKNYNYLFKKEEEKSLESIGFIKNKSVLGVFNFPTGQYSKITALKDIKYYYRAFPKRAEVRFETFNELFEFLKIIITK